MRRHDKWAHRRGEPRVFAFVWTLFLFAATVTTFVSAQASGAGDRATIRGAAVMLLLAGVLGVTVLWPMARLSQSPEPRPVRGTLRDLVVLVVPLQALLWPQAMWWLARWPLSVIVAVDLVILSWAVLVGGALALVQAARLRRLEAWTDGSTALVMVGFLALVGGGALAARPEPLMAPDGGDVTPAAFRASWMLSPATALLEVTRDSWSGMWGTVRPGHLAASAVTLLAGIPAWIVSARLVRGRVAPTRLN